MTKSGKAWMRFDSTVLKDTKTVLFKTFSTTLGAAALAAKEDGAEYGLSYVEKDYKGSLEYELVGIEKV